MALRSRTRWGAAGGSKPTSVASNGVVRTGLVGNGSLVHNNRPLLGQGESQLSLDRVDGHGIVAPLASATSDLSLAESDERRIRYQVFDLERRTSNMSSPEGNPPIRPPPPEVLGGKSLSSQPVLTNGIISPTAFSSSPLTDEMPELRPQQAPDGYANGDEVLYDEAETVEDELAPLPVVFEHPEQASQPPIPRRSPSTMLGPSPALVGEVEKGGLAAQAIGIPNGTAGVFPQSVDLRERHRHPSPPDGVGSVTLDKLATSPPSQSPTGVRDGDVFAEQVEGADRAIAAEREIPMRPSSSGSQRSRPPRSEVHRSSSSSIVGIPDSIRSCAPWQRKHLFRICQNARQAADRALQQVPPLVLDRLSLFLYRFLVRILREARALSWRFSRCARHEIVAAIALVAPRSVADPCIAAGAKAKSQYTMPTACLRTAKSTRCGLIMPVGRLHQWLVQCEVAPVVSDDAAIYLAAAVEQFGELVVQRALNTAENDNPGTVTVDLLDFGVSACADLWAVVHKHANLVSAGVTSDGSPSTTIGRSRDALGTPRPLFNGDSLDSQSNSRTPSLNRRSSSHSTTSSSAAIPCSPLSSRSMGLMRQTSGDLPPALTLAAVDSREQLDRLVAQGVAEMQESSAERVPIYSPVLRRRSAVPARRSPSSSPALQPPTFSPTQLPRWSSCALNALHYFMSTHRPAVAKALHHFSDQRQTPFAVDVKPLQSMPPLSEWIRVASVHAQYRCSPIVDEDDVLQAARLLVVGVDHPPRPLRPFLTWVHVDMRDISREEIQRYIQTEQVFIMAENAQPNLLPSLICLLGEDGAGAMNAQGLTLLMLAATMGQEVLAEQLIALGADLNQTVPPNNCSHPAVMTCCVGWTALTFAVVHDHLGVVKLLLESEANVEGDIDMSCETPLQLASAAGNFEMVKLLLAHNADPLHSPALSLASHYAASGVQGADDWDRSSLSSACALSASHGRKEVLSLLLAQPVNAAWKSTERLNLQEILAEAEGSQQRQDTVRKMRQQCMQEALYLAAEHGHLELALVLRQRGVPWTLHSWGQALDMAFHSVACNEYVQPLMLDFSTIIDYEASSSFFHDTLPLLFTMIRGGQVSDLSHHAAVVLQTCYGKDPPVTAASLPPVQSDVNRLDPSYVNNPQVSDIVFLVEGKEFYASRVILHGVSSKFQQILATGKPTSTGQLLVDVLGIRYVIFEIVVRYIYSGGIHLNVDPMYIPELIVAATYFGLQRLHQHCEVVAMQALTVDNSVDIYRHAKLNQARSLAIACEGFFLSHLTQMLRKALFQQLLISGSSTEFIEGLRLNIIRRLKQRGSFTQNTIVTAC